MFKYILILIAYITTPFMANAQSPNCAPREQVISRLATTYGESRQTVALGPNNTIVEMFASEETGSWTVIVTYPTNISCLVVSGTDFELVVETLPNNDEKL